MKKKYLSAAFTAAMLFATTSSLLAQETPRKKFFVGTSFGFSSSTRETVKMDVGTGAPTGVTEMKYTYWHVAPQFGWFIRERFALGVEGSYGHYENVGPDYAKKWGAGIFGRFLVPIWTSRFSVYNDLVLNFDHQNSYSHSTVPFRNKFNTVGLYYRPGLQFRLKSNINLLASMGNVFGYSYRTEKRTPYANTINYPETKSTSHNVGFSDRFNINDLSIGVNFLF